MWAENFHHPSSVFLSKHMLLYLINDSKRLEKLAHYYHINSIKRTQSMEHLNWFSKQKRCFHFNILSSLNSYQLKPGALLKCPGTTLIAEFELNRMKYKLQQIFIIIIIISHTFLCQKNVCM